MRDANRRKMRDRPGPGLSRRTLLKAGAAAAAAGSLTVFSRSARAKDRLRVLAWPGYEGKKKKGSRAGVRGGRTVSGSISKPTSAVSRCSNSSLTRRAEPTTACFSTPNTCASSPPSTRLSPTIPEKSPELANYHPVFANMRQIQAGGGQAWGTPTRFGFYAISYNSDHMSREESEDWNSLFLPQIRRQDRRSGLVSAEHGQCEPRGSSQQGKSLRPERRATGRGSEVAAQAQASCRHAGRHFPARRAGDDRRRCPPPP